MCICGNPGFRHSANFWTSEVQDDFDDNSINENWQEILAVQIYISSNVREKKLNIMSHREITKQMSLDEEA